MQLENGCGIIKSHYNGLSVLPYNGGTYTQAPFEDITEEKYEELMVSLNM